MAPFSKAVAVKEAALDDAVEKRKVYLGVVDPEWAVGSVPNGGYVLALIMEACIRYQSRTTHVDPIHITAHYLRTSSVASFEVHVKTLKTGKGFTNLTAELIQEGSTRVTTHVIFGTNVSSPSDKFQLTLSPPSSYARRIPLSSHPSQRGTAYMSNRWKFHKRVQWTEEADILARNKPDSPNRTDNSTVGGGGLEWGSWYEFTDKEETITNVSLVFLADIFLNTPTLLPRSEKPGLTKSWFPTMTLAVEFKAPIPPSSAKHARRTVGLYSLGRFLNHPQGRHEAYVEVWTAPSGIGEGEPVEGWRDDQVCLAIATQMALTLPMEVNEKKGRKQTSKL